MLGVVSKADIYYSYVVLVLGIAISTAFLIEPERISFNYHFSVFITGIVASASTNRLLNRWVIPSVFLMTCFIFFIFINPLPYSSLNRTLRLLLALPLAVIILYYLGFLIGRWVKIRLPLVPLALFVLLFYLSFLLLVKNHLYSITFWVIFSYLISYFLSKKGFSYFKILGIFSIYPIISIILFSIDPNDFFWYIIIPSFMAIAIGICTGYYLAARETTNPFIISFSVFLLLIGSFGLPILSKNIDTLTATSNELLQIDDVQFIHNGDTLSLRSFEGKIVVMDFWHSRCGVCFKKFPEFEKLKEEFKDNPNVMFFAVNSPIGKENPGDAAPIMDKLGYSFENLYLLSPNSYQDFGVQFFPTLVIINNDQTKVIRTSIELSPLVINNSTQLIYSLLDKEPIN